MSRLPADDNGGTCAAIINLSVPSFVPRPEWEGGGWEHITQPQRQPSPAEQHYDAAEAALAAFEAGGDWRHGLAALVHAVLSIDVTEAGNR